MKGYLGEFDVDMSQTRFANYSPADWAMEFISAYGQIDGGHHKQWVLDQVARILHGTSVKVMERRWDNGQTELCFWTDDASAEYLAWVKEMLGEEIDGEYEYGYDEGIAP